MKIPSEYFSKGYAIRDSKKKKWYVNIAFASSKMRKPFAIFVTTNHKESSEVTDDTITELLKLAINAGIHSDVVQAFVDSKINKVSNINKITKTLSLLLRHNVRISDIVDVLDDGNYPLSSFTFHIKRLLKQFIPDGAEVEGKLVKSVVDK